MLSFYTKLRYASCNKEKSDYFKDHKKEKHNNMGLRTEKISHKNDKTFINKKSRKSIEDESDGNK